jgi:hypothetical protein
MHVTIAMVFNLDTGKRTSRFVEVFDPLTGQTIDGPLAKQLLLPRQLPQEWLPASLRTGRSGPVRSWVDRSLFVPDSDDGPEGLLG